MLLDERSNLSSQPVVAITIFFLREAIFSIFSNAAVGCVKQIQTSVPCKDFSSISEKSASF